MNRHVDMPDPRTHQAVQQMLPWLLAGTLDADEVALAEQHLGECAACRTDLAWQRKLRAAAPAADGAFDADRAFAQLLPRLGPQAPRTGTLTRWRRAAAANDAWLRWTAAAELAAIG
ncbi:MAG TPA: zf-HC2 domain-containing protein, partial [Telluria sp.]|nr:zf-HC2 domain-containing protein [Telluria sp.]